MMDRADTSHEGATVCPFVAFGDDRERRATDPDHRHRCYAEPLPAPRAIAHQRRYCLAPEFPSCPIFQDWAIRAATTGVAMPSSRSVGAERGAGLPVAPPPPPAAAGGPVNGGARRRHDWTDPPPWTAPNAAAGEALVAGSRDQPGGSGDDGTTALRRAASEPADRPRTGRGFAYDLIAADAAFAAPDVEEVAAGPADAQGAGGGDGRAYAAAAPSSYAPPSHAAPIQPPPPPAPRRSMYVTVPDADDTPPEPPANTAWAEPAAAPRRDPAPPVMRVAGGLARDTTDKLPAPDYLPPARHTASQAQRRVSPFEGDREWEKPRRFEAYPTLRTRVSMGMPGMPRVGRFPPVLLAAIALALAAGALFMLPSFLPGPDSGGSVVSPSAGSSASAGPTVTAAPTPTPAPTPVVYIVKRGDTFSAIARRHGVTMDALKAANPQIVNINALQIGDRVNIPDPDATPSVGTSPVLSPDASPGDETDLPGTPEP